jgi:uncharacterized protein
MLILLHTSKTMRSDPAKGKVRPPQLSDKAWELAIFLKTLSVKQIASAMKISGALAQKTHDLIAAWTPASKAQTIAIDSFIGDIYSGLQAPTLSKAEREYADKTLVILSGLYGIIRPLDGICPYRLEMGYKLPDRKYANLYKFWGDSIAKRLPKGDGPIVNLAAVEYSRTVTPFIDESRVIAPQFLTVNPKTGEPTFVVVHAKIARGAFAHWLITSRVNKMADLTKFNDLNYRYNKALSTPASPAFVCDDFGGIGLSIRLQDKEG